MCLYPNRRPIMVVFVDIIRDDNECLSPNRYCRRQRRLTNNVFLEGYVRLQWIPTRTRLESHRHKPQGYHGNRKTCPTLLSKKYRSRRKMCHRWKSRRIPTGVKTEWTQCRIRRYRTRSKRPQPFSLSTSLIQIIGFLRASSHIFPSYKSQISAIAPWL